MEMRLPMKLVCILTCGHTVLSQTRRNEMAPPKGKVPTSTDPLRSLEGEETCSATCKGYMGMKHHKDHFCKEVAFGCTRCSECLNPDSEPAPGNHAAPAKGTCSDQCRVYMKMKHHIAHYCSPAAAAWGCTGCDECSNSDSEPAPAPTVTSKEPAPPKTTAPKSTTKETTDSNTPEPSQPAVPTAGNTQPANPRPNPTNTGCSSDVTSTRHVLMGYYANWLQWRKGGNSFKPEDIQGDKITHLNYAFAMLGSETYAEDGTETYEIGGGSFSIRHFEDNDLPGKYPLVDGYNSVNKTLKDKYPHLKTLISLGGWSANTPADEDTDSAGRMRRLDKGWNEFVFSDMVSTPENRKKFIDSVFIFCRKWGFDGVDLDWEYPGDTKRGGRVEDKQNFGKLMRELRAAIEKEDVPEGKTKLLLTLAVGVGPSTVEKAYDIPMLDETCDFINLMTYDLYGGWDTTKGTNLHSQLKSPKEGELSGDSTIQQWVAAGARKEKLNLGLATYSRSFTLASSEKNQGIYAAATGFGKEQPFSQQKGTATMYEMNKLIADGADSTFDPERCAAYLQDGDLWMGYDDVETMKCKAKYVKEQGLLGAFSWDLGEDDFKNGSPLMTVFHDAFFCDGAGTPEVAQEEVSEKEDVPAVQEVPEVPEVAEEAEEALPEEEVPEEEVTVSPEAEVDTAAVAPSNPPTGSRPSGKPSGKVAATYFSLWGGNTAYASIVKTKPIANIEEDNLCGTHPGLCKYNVIIVAFIITDKAGKFVLAFSDPGKPSSIPVYDETKLKAFIRSLQSAGKHVLVSVGGQFFDVKWGNFDKQVAEVEAILDKYGFDGLDLDFEGSHIPGGEEAEKVGTQIKRLVESRRAGGSDFWLTAAPEWPYVTPYSYGGLFSQNYKQLFGAIGMDVFTYIWPQMYNQGQANGIKGPKGKASPADNIAKFLAEMVWATSTDEGLDASGNAGIKIPLGKLVLGIPAAQGAAGGEMTYVAKPADITRAYQLAKAQGTEITGFMTWSADFDNMKIDHYGHVHEPWATVDAIIKG